MTRPCAATPSDLATLASLHATSFSETWNAEAFGQLLRSPGTFALLAEDGGSASGFILVRTVADEAEILSIGVRPTARRQGMGESLIRAAAEDAGRLTAKKMFLEVGAGNRAARSLYGRLGFREIGRRRGYYRQPGGALEDALALGADLPLAGSRLGKPSEVD